MTGCGVTRFALTQPTSFTNYIKVTFFRGTSLRPVPPGTSKQKDVRYLDIHEGQLDEAQLADWVQQASRLPGERM